jgi:hypothetical protein
MPTATVEQEVLELEKTYWQAIKDRDVETVMRLSDDPCTIAGAQGVRSIDRRTLAGLMKDTPYTMHSFNIGTDAEVRMLGNDVAIIAYEVHEDLTVDGKPVSLDAADTSTWVRRNGSWVCALHTESLRGDPFGRDRSGG